MAAENGDSGRVYDLFFDDEFWVIRYLVADTGHWLPGRKVLITPGVMGTPDWENRRFPVALTRERVEKSPAIDTDKPVSRQEEIRLERHYGWHTYQAPVGAVPLPLFAKPPLEAEGASESVSEQGDPHLRSVKEVSEYHIHAADGGIGHVEDFIADDYAWDIRYLVLDTRNWVPGRKVLLSLQRVGSKISWDERKVSVTLTKEHIRDRPEFDPTAPVNREYETRLLGKVGTLGCQEVILFRMIIADQRRPPLNGRTASIKMASHKTRWTACFGNFTVNSEPVAGPLATVTWPSCACTTALTRLKPRPKPRSERLLSPR